VSRLRIAAIDFLNPAPLMWDFDHPPQSDELRRRYAVDIMMPSQCAQRLAEGTADLGLVPVAAYATITDLLIVPGCAIASKGAIRSLLLVVKESVGIAGLRTIAADTSSRATLAYLHILLRRYWTSEASVFQHRPHLDAMLEQADAALLIGDPALLALEDGEARERRTGERLLYVDLAEEWRRQTGLAWVSAVWAVRADALCGDRVLRRALLRDLLRSRDAGLANREMLVTEWSRRLPLPAATVRSYLNENIHYLLDDECIRGLQGFFELAAECGVLPEAPALRWMEE
jgi:chorismate dehydratase